MGKAQIELLVCDQPLVVYHHKEDKSKPKKANPVDVMRAQHEWMRKYGNNPDQKIHIDFSKFSVPKENIE